jgi:PPOX class probable F420-dependent enzyme
MAAFDGEKYLSLESFRRDGRGVRTALWFAAGPDGTLYAYTMAKSGKVKRIRRNGAVRVAPCDARGRVTGGWVDATAELVGGASFDLGMRLLNKKYWPIKQMLDLTVLLFSRHQRAMIAIRLVSGPAVTPA